MPILSAGARTPLVSGRGALAPAPGNVAAPAIVTPPAGLLWDLMSAANASKSAYPLSNNQYDGIALRLGGENRDWNATLNGPVHRYSGCRYYYAWLSIPVDSYPQWQPSWRRVWRVYRKGTSGQALRTLVFECEHNTAAVPTGDQVWFVMNDTYNGGLLPDAAWNIGGYSLSMKTKMACSGSTGSTDQPISSRSYVEVSFPQDLPAINYSPPLYKPESWAADEPRLWLVHHSFYANAATKTLRFPYSWHFEICKSDVVGNGGHLILGGLQGIPTWRCWTKLMNMCDAALVTELYRMEQQALADFFGATDPRRVMNELENEPVEDWVRTDGKVGFRQNLLDVLYPTARSAWGAERTFLLKGTSYGSINSLRDQWDLDNDAHFGGGSNMLGNHNYNGQPRWPNSSRELWWDHYPDCQQHATWLHDAITRGHFKGGGMSELGVSNAVTPIDSRGRMLGKMHTAMHERNLFVAYWGLTGDHYNCSYLYRDVEGANGALVEAVWPELRPYAGKAGRSS